MWVFDDPRVGLDKEPFVSGADDMIDVLVADIPNADKGFRLLFSATPFPGHTVKLEWRREESGGNWYFAHSSELRAGCVRRCSDISIKLRQSFMPAPNRNPVDLERGSTPKQRQME